MSDIDEAVAAFQQHGTKAAAARALNVPVTTLKSRLERAHATSTLYGADGEPKLTWVKERAGAPTPAEVAEQIRAALDGYTPPTAFPAAPSSTDKDLATVYVCADWHVGLLSWAKETKHNWDLKIGRSTIQTAMSRLINSTPSSSQAVVLGLGDLLHSDNYDNQTSRSKNVLDVDGRYPRVLQAATELLMFTIDLALAKHESVLVRVLPGNHDDQSALAVTLALSLYYKHNDRVTVDDDAGRFFFWQWGKVLIGATHGDKAKMAQLPLILAARNPEAWSKTKFRHCYTGHIHREAGKKDELSGVTVESFQTPVAPDAWHVAMGYGAGRSVSAITHHRDQGEIIRNKVNIV